MSSSMVALFLTLGLTLGSAARGAAQSGTLVAQRLSLQAAVDALIAKNLSVVAARYNIDLARAQRVAAALKPDLTVILSATQLTIPRVLSDPRYLGVAVADNSVLIPQYGIDVEKIVERGGKRELRVAQADVGTRVAEAQLANELRQQTFELKQAFLSALLAGENLRVFRENLRDFGRMQQLFSAQVKEGYTAGVDLRRIGLERVEVENNLSTARTDYWQGVRDVFNLIGEGERESLGAPQIARIATTGTGLPQAGDAGAAEPADVLEGDLSARTVDLGIAELRTLALANRPDLRAAQLVVDAADTGVKLAEATRARDLSLGGQYLRSGPDNAVGVTLGVPLTTGKRADAAVAQAAVTKLQAEARFRQTQAQVLTEVEKAFLAYRISRERLALFDGQILRQALEVRNIEQIAYREGERGLLNVLDAQRTYNQTLVNYNEARHAFALSVYQLESATGTNATLLAAVRPSGAGVSHD
jgi:cobalt-zinc-cadmium efflux system outer membrane protein